MKCITFFVAVSMLLLAGCKKETTRTIDVSYKPDMSQSKFKSSTTITNPYHPVTAGKKYIYEGQTPDGLERIEEQRLTTTKTILGIDCIVVEFKAFLKER